MLYRVLTITVFFVVTGAQIVPAQTNIFSEVPFWRDDLDGNNTAVALGDLDLDGDLDIVFCSYGDLRIRAYENLGFEIAQQPYWTMVSPDTTLDIALGDINGDGYLDLVCGNSSAQPCKLYLNTGNGFSDTPVWTAPRPEYTYEVALGDVDNDGDLDLVCANDWFYDFDIHEDPQIHQNTLYLNEGGVFAAEPAWQSNSYKNRSTCVALGDIDGDGDLDAAFAGKQKPIVLYENVGGVFTADSVWASADVDYSYDITFGDIDGDGDLDLAQAIHSLGHVGNRLFENTGSGLDTIWVWESNEQLYTWSLDLGDVDGDGDLDLVCGNKLGPNTCYINNGNWLTADPVWYSQANAASFGTALGDMDGNGTLDAVFANGDGQNAVYENVRIGFLESPTWAPDEGISGFAALGDKSGNGYPDLVIGTISDVYRDVIHLNSQGTLSAQSWPVNETYHITRAATLADLNHDGDIDLVTLTADLELFVYEGIPGGLFTAQPVWTPGESRCPRDFSLADIDNDGDFDLVTAGFCYADTGLSGAVFENKGTWFSPQATVLLPGPFEDRFATYDIATGDVDLDGDPDVVISCFEHQIILLENRNAGSVFEVVWIIDDGDKTSGIALADFDQDGDLDLLRANSGFPAGTPNKIFENTGGVFADDPIWISPTTYTTVSVAAGDVDGDGDLDIAFGNMSDPHALYRNTQNGLDDVPVWLSDYDDVFSSPGLLFEDIDRDGDLDLVNGRPLTMFSGIRNPAYKGDLEYPTNHTPNNSAFISIASAEPAGVNAWSVEFTVKDVESDLVWVTGDYQFTGEPVWRPIEIVGGRHRVGPFVATPDGITGSLSWNTFEVPFDHRDVVLRLKTIEIPQRVSIIQNAATYNLPIGSIVPRRPELSASADTLMFSDSTVTVGDTMSLDLSVFNSGTEDLVVDRIELPSDEMRVERSVPFTLVPGQAEVINVFLEPRRETDISGEITFQSNDPVNSVHSIAVSADIRPLAFSSKLLNPATELPLGEAVTVVVTPEPQVRIESGYVLHRTAGGAEFSDSVLIEPLEDQFVATIRGEYIREAGLEYYIRVENSGVYSTDPPGAPEDSLYTKTVEQPDGVSCSPVPNLGSGFLEGLDVKVLASLPVGAIFDDGWIFYRPGGETGYDSVPIGPGEPAPFGVIPDSVTGPTGIEYWALVNTQTRTLTDPAVDPAGNPYAIRITTPNLAEPRTHTGMQFRMLSIPLEVGAPITGVVTDDLGGPDPSKWRMFAWEGGRYVELPNDEMAQFEQGRSYWLITKENHRLDTAPATGVSTPTDRPFEIELQPGWNLVGNPFHFEVAWDSCVVDTMTMGDAEGALVVEPPKFWNGSGYTAGDGILEPFGGCWVRNLTDSVVTLGVPPVHVVEPVTQVIAADGAADPGSWRIVISARSGNSEDAYNIAGVLEEARNERDRHDRFEPPASPDGGVSLYFPHENWDLHPGHYTVDMRGEYQPLEGEIPTLVANGSDMWGHIWWFDVDAPSGEQVTLDFTAENLPAEAVAYVVDFGSGRAVDLLLDTQLDSYAGQFALLVGSEVFVSETRDQLPGPPTQTVLHQNVPNPFNPTTVIRYELARPTHVDLRVYDVSGALVRVLEDRDLPVGRYETVWKGENDAGHRVSSGVYFYRLTADGVVNTRKMLLLK